MEIKPKRVGRRKSPSLPFQQIETTNEVAEMKVWNNSSYNTAIEHFPRGIVSSVYCNLIPLHCVFINTKKRWNTSLLSESCKPDDFSEKANNLLSIDDKQCYYTMINQSNNWCRNPEHIINNEEIRFGLSGSIKRTWRSALGAYNFFVGTEVTNTKPTMISVILPENLEYHRLRYAAEMPVDLSKVIILIDKEIFNTTYPIKPARAFFKKHILPEVMKSSCTVFKVPMSYILKNCFHTEYEFEGKGISALKEHKDIKDKFINSEINQYAITSQEEEEDDDYEEETELDF